MDHHLKTVQEAIWSNNSIKKKKKPTSPNPVTKIQQEIVKEKEKQRARKKKMRTHSHHGCRRMLPSGWVHNEQEKSNSQLELPSPPTLLEPSTRELRSLG